MYDLIDRIKANFICMKNDNSGVAVVEIILILVVLIGLVIVFKTQAASLVTKIWKTINENASTVTG